jgi:Rrf2 family transcriptional regulator, iron-sulfur cluster assembly transcription factor
VRLEITRKADLACRALVLLARDGGRTKSADLAAALDTTAGFVPQILGPLVERGWIASVPGPTGGYEAAITPDGLSILEVIEAIEGPTVTGRCIVVDRPCNQAGHCTLHHPWSRARAGLLEELSRTTLADLEVP